MRELPQYIRGDGPCHDCGTEDNPVWYTDNVFWNDVMDDDRNRILCVYCFIIRAEQRYQVKSWRLVPDWRWQER